MLTNSTTKYESLKARLIKICQTLLEAFENDIESGIADGIYEKKDNRGNRKLIKEAKELIRDFSQYWPSIYMYVEGGQIQGISGTENIIVLKFDQEDFDASTGPYMDGMTPESWDEMINEKTANKDIKAIY